MPSFGWRELGLLLVVLSALAVLLRSGDPGADPVRTASASTNDAAAPDREAATSPPIAGAASREAAPARKRGGTPRATAARPPAVPRADEAQREWSIPPPTASPVFGRTAAKAATAPAAPTAPAPSPAPSLAEKFWAGCANPTGFAGDGRIVFPLPGAYLDSYGNTWGAPRPQGSHEGTDLMVPAGTPELAVTDGTLVSVAGSNANGWNSLGGYAVMLRADYSVGPIKAGDLLYYAHLNAGSQLPIGARVRAGQVLGYAGDTGQGPEVTRGLFPPHLHFGWYDGGGAGGTRSALPSGAINPYPMLEWIKANGGAGGADAGRCAAPGVGAPVPATSPATQGRWAADDSPGLGPDLDTGSGDPRPAPAPATREPAPRRTADLAEKRTPAQRNPREQEKPPREAATPKPGAEAPDREPSTSATAGPPAPAKPPERPAPGPRTQDTQAPEPTKPEPTREPGARGPGTEGPDAQEPGAADLSKPASPAPPAPARPVPPAVPDDPPPRLGSSSEATVEIEDGAGPTPDAPAGTVMPDVPDVGTGSTAFPSDERGEGREAAEDVRGVVVGGDAAEATRMVEQVEPVEPAE